MEKIINLFIGVLFVIALTGCGGSNTKSSYSVRYDGNGNTSGTVPVDAGKYYAGDPVTVLYNGGTLEKSLYTFTGWNTTANRTGTSYVSGDTFSIEADDVTLYAEWGWTRLLGAASTLSEGHGIAVDANGNSYVVGYTQGNFDGQTKTGATDLFVSKYDVSGVKQWSKLLGVSGYLTEGFGIALDSTGNLYITGFTQGSIDGQTYSGGDALFVAKYDTSGNRQWTRLLGAGPGTVTRGFGISVDTNGNSYI
ncbi:MAG TPA: SBBP repeat-containing protein, partial [Spirochaetota bacterium]